MKLYDFIDNSGSFESRIADKIKGLYFPLANHTLMSSISPSLHGDIKTSQDSFLLTPVSRQDLIDLKASRNFWVYINKNKIWSATGVSKNPNQINKDKFNLKAGLLWHKVSCENQNMGLRAEILSFVPLDEPIEIMQVKITNITKKKVRFIPCVAIPIYARSANNLRDHRQVTSLLQRIILHKFGVIVKPTLVFDESGHRQNKTMYFVLGWDEKLTPPQYIYPTQKMFCGEGGDLEAPLSILNDLAPRKLQIQGREAMAALRLRAKTLKKNESYNYIIVMGITEDKHKIKDTIIKFNSLKKCNQSFNKSNAFWIANSQRIKLTTGDSDFDNWFRWVSIQPILRKIYGCSFLPDFDYGKGGRGWRDLWQDCLGMILNRPHQVRSLLIKNLSGVRIDGSNATIIGKEHAEFKSDRNNISRVWMDHGVWPLLALELYINETGDYSILFEQTTYFRNHEICRVRSIDYKWQPDYGQNLRTSSGKIYKATVLEHLLVENLVQFFNVGFHNFIRLEDADWNDGLDMAAGFGESVTFTAMYANNLQVLSDLLYRTGKRKIKIAKELKILLRKINYNDKNAKLKILEEYFTKTKFVVSGEKINIDASRVAADLKNKSEWMKADIRKREWLRQGFFNGYYDNKKERVEGSKNGLIRMMLASQVFPILSNVAQDWQIDKILKSVNKYLFDKKLKGYHLNTDFQQEQHNLGRAFSFAYGDKENGAFFNHMIVMFAYALYKRNFIKEGWQVLKSIYQMAHNSERSKIYPCLPEYFNLQGRGMYLYLTGSASWFVLTVLAEVFGVKGKEGDFLIEPKISPEMFNRTLTVNIERIFSGRRFCISYTKSKVLKSEGYKIIRASLNSENLPLRESARIIIKRKKIANLSKNKLHKINILLS